MLYIRIRSFVFACYKHCRTDFCHLFALQSAFENSQLTLEIRVRVKLASFFAALLQRLNQSEVSMLNHISAAESCTTRNTGGAMDEHTVALVFGERLMHKSVCTLEILQHILL